MTHLRHHSSRPDHWTHPRCRDARHMTHGEIEALEQEIAWGLTIGRWIVLILSATVFVGVTASLVM